MYHVTNVLNLFLSIWFLIGLEIYSLQQCCYNYYEPLTVVKARRWHATYRHPTRSSGDTNNGTKIYKYIQD